MTTRALVIDNDKMAVEELTDVLDSLQHGYDCARSHDQAWKLLKKEAYSYILLEMSTPARSGRRSRRENGLNFIGQLRRFPGREGLPVIAMVGERDYVIDLAIPALRVGAAHFLEKPLTGDKLDRTILEALGLPLTPATLAPAARSPKLAPFRAGRRELVIYPDHAELCGVTVWTDTGSLDMREILIRLSKRNATGYVRIKGTNFETLLGRDASNPVGRPIKDLRDRATLMMAKYRALKCGKLDVINRGGGGYYLNEWIDARVADEEPAAHMVAEDPPKPEVKAKPRPEPRPESKPAPDRKKASRDVRPLNRRQKWIMEQLEGGLRLRFKEILRYMGVNRSTVNRDLKDLRDRGLITTHAEGYYVRTRREKQRTGPCQGTALADNDREVH